MSYKDLDDFRMAGFFIGGLWFYLIGISIILFLMGRRDELCEREIMSSAASHLAASPPGSFSMGHFEQFSNFEWGYWIALTVLSMEILSKCRWKTKISYTF
jgi:hypothetical protein